MALSTPNRGAFGSQSLDRAAIAMGMSCVMCSCFVAMASPNTRLATWAFSTTQALYAQTRQGMVAFVVPIGSRCFMLGQ
eukprot:3481008-Pyramimonas_sp.AAC.1